MECLKSEMYFRTHRTATHAPISWDEHSVLGDWYVMTHWAFTYVLTSVKVYCVPSISSVAFEHQQVKRIIWFNSLNIQQEGQ